MRAEAGGRPSDRHRALEGLTARLAELLGLADLFGRRRVEIVLRRMVGEPAVAAAAQVETPDPLGQGVAGLVPRITWEEAVLQIANRYPATVPEEVRRLGTEAVQEWIGGLYRQQGLTLARTSQGVVVERIQQILSRALKGGRERQEVIDEILQAGGEHGDDWTRAYAQTVYRNNLSTAYHAGLEEQIQTPAARRVIGALQFVAAMDSDTTPICRAAHGTLAPPDHEVWDDRTPPLHHNCRSGLRMVNWADLKRMGALDESGVVRPQIPNWPSGVAPQPGFGGRR